MSKIVLNDTTVKKLPVGKYFDKTTPAFGIRVGKNRRTWIVQRGQDRRIIRVGHYPAMSLSEARTKGKQLLATTDLNPERITFQEAYEIFKRVHVARLKARTQTDYTRNLERHYLPKLGRKRLDAITSHMVNAIADELVDTPAEQSHTIAYGKTFFKWCVRRHYIQRSPLDGATLPKQQSRDRVLTDHELVAVWRAAERYGGHYGTILRLLILTGMRRGECAAIETSWVKNDTLTLPKHITKNGREHTFPLGALTVGLLTRSFPAITPNTSAVLFPARITSSPTFSGFSQCKKNIDKMLNIAPWTVHDLRRSFATKLAELGVAPHIIEALINHQTGSLSAIAKIYNRASYMPEMRAAVELWEARLQKLLA